MNKVKAVYTASNKNEKILKKSSSGGVFYSISKFVIEKKGYVFGAGYDDNNRVRHMMIADVNDIYKLMGSKYVQSDIEDTYRLVESLLKENKLVLFSGTPCQINGLDKYLGKKYNTLITLDVICHGVPNLVLLNNYINSCIGESVTDINFRDKKVNWEDYFVTFKCNNKSCISEEFYNNQFMRLFLSDIILRPTCYQCINKNENHIADITIGDYWGVKDIEIDKYNPWGTSLVILHTALGKRVWDEICTDFIYDKVTNEKWKNYNTSYEKSAIRPWKRVLFFHKLEKNNVFLNIDYFKNKFLFERAYNKFQRWLKTKKKEKEKKRKSFLESKKKKYCYGCYACYNICPVNAINMKCDSEGYKYPEIDENVCIHCNKCRNVCDRIINMR